MREQAALLHALHHWHTYLIGREFILRTDHNPILALAKGKMKSYDTLTDKILKFMPFKMEFMNPFFARQMSIKNQHSHL